MDTKLANIHARKYSRDDNIDMLKNLQLKYGNDIFLHVKEDTKETCMFGAGPKATKFLLELGLDPTLKNYKGESAITYCLNYKYYDSLKVLADFNSIANDLLEEYNLRKIEEINKIDPISKIQQDIDLLHKKLDMILSKLS
jgi:hypothetical protein